jgi:hypothetical protein
VDEVSGQNVQSIWASEWGSGYVAATEGTNKTQYLSLNGYVLNGTSRKISHHAHRTFALNNSRPGGIAPIIPTFDNWTRIEAMQQGVTADVNCTATPASDPYSIINQTTLAPGIIINQIIIEPGIIKVSSCCNCTSGNTDQSG